MPSLTAVSLRLTLANVSQDASSLRSLVIDLFERLSKEPGFVSAVLHDDVDRPGELLVYETWSLSREQYLRDVRTKPYWDFYERRLVELRVEREARWLRPIASWPP
ncbi:MAG: antibiotic biosynthesis monooxygenase [Tepidisphaera sp.]|nr:antibiotic biosynthesis monooxygenase [Tepidisphaera sp.]